MKRNEEYNIHVYIYIHIYERFFWGGAPSPIMANKQLMTITNLFIFRSIHVLGNTLVFRYV